jgi:hypothetical protein
VRAVGRNATAGDGLIVVEVGQRFRQLHESSVVRPHAVAVVIAPDPRELGDRKVHLHARAFASVGPDAAEEVPGKLGPVDESKERAFGVGVRKDPHRPHLVSVREDDTHGTAVPHIYPVDLGVGADLRPDLAGSVRDQRRPTLL